MIKYAAFSLFGISFLFSSAYLDAGRVLNKGKASLEYILQPKSLYGVKKLQLEKVPNDIKRICSAYCIYAVTLIASGRKLTDTQEKWYGIAIYFENKHKAHPIKIQEANAIKLKLEDAVLRRSSGRI